MKRILAILSLLAISLNVNAQEAAVKPAKQSAKAQVISFYAAVNENNAAQGMIEMLVMNPSTKPEDAQNVANSFASRMAQMGKFLDFEIMSEKEITARVKVIKTTANFENQPFVIEYTFYDSGSGNWRLAHLRYDSNVATMFQDELD